MEEKRQGSQTESPPCTSHWGREIYLALLLAGTHQTADSLPSPAACLPRPIGLNATGYFTASLPTFLLTCLCLAQAFGYRLRRVIAAFYFPKVNWQKLHL